MPIHEVLSNDFEATLIVAGVKLRVEMEPGCWITGNPLGIMVRANAAISGAVYRSKRDYYKATMADLNKLIKRIKIVRCSLPGCKGRLLFGDDTAENNPALLCQKHRLAGIHERWKKEESREVAKRKVEDAKAKARGFRYKAKVWIHRNDRSDSYILTYYRTKPSKVLLRRQAKRHGSKILGDDSVEKL